MAKLESVNNHRLTARANFIVLIHSLSSTFDSNSTAPSLVITSLPKVIWEQGRVAAAVPGAGWHKGLRIRNVSFVFVKDRCVRKRAVF